MPKEEALSASRLSLASNIGLAGVKIVVGLVGSSYAMIADGIESLADCISSVIVWNGLRVGAKEPDPEHPYGHGKAEAIATLLAGLGLVASGGIIAFQAVHEILQKHPPPESFTVPALIAIILVKELLYRYLNRKALVLDSGLLKAEAWHHRSDSLTSIAVLVGLCVAVFAGPQFAPADDIAALMVTILIFLNAYKIMRPAIDELMDRNITGERFRRVRQAILETPGVCDVETLWIHRSGRQYHVDTHIEVDGEITVREGHQIAHQVKDKLLDLKEIEIAYVGTHVEPHDHGPQP